jgi:hypothetical protein
LCVELRRWAAAEVGVDWLVLSVRDSNARAIELGLRRFSR